MSRSIRFWSTAAAILLMLGSAAPFAQSANPFRFDSPSQPLADALRAFGSQTNLNLMFDTPLVAGRTAPAVKAELTPDQMLDALLQGTGIKHEFVNETTVVLTAGKTIAANEMTQVEPHAAASSAATATVDHAGTDDTNAEVVVTGTNIRGEGTQTSQRITYSRDDIKTSGASDLSDLLRQIPQNFAGGDSGATPDGRYGRGFLSALNDSGVSSPNLRGLGSGATLTLLNGHRLAPTAQSTITDISLIPLSAIERVEIVLDGASAVYGADAVGGVFNIKLREDFEGIEGHLRAVSDGSADYTHLTGGIGGGTHWGSGDAFFAGTVSKYGDLPLSERTFTAHIPAGQTADGLFAGMLYPRETNYSVLGHIRQGISTALTLSADGWYGNKDHYQVLNQPSLSTPAVAEQRANVDEYNISTSADYAAFGGWLISATGSYSGSKERNKRRTTTLIALPQRILNVDADTSVWSAGIKGDGTLFHGWAGDVRAALGAEYRSESYDAYFEQYAVGSPLASLTTGTQRNARAAYAELSVPIVEKNENRRFLYEVGFSGAARYDDYSDFGSATNHKLGIRLAPVRGVTLRSTYSTSFRAPELYNVDRAGRLGISAVDLSGFFLNPAGPGTANVAVITGTSPLEAERSKAYSAGIDIEPAAMPGFALSATWFKYDYTGKFGNVPIAPDLLRRTAEFSTIITPATPALLQSLVNQALSGGGFANLVQPYSNYGYVVDASTRNLAKQIVSGVDLAASYKFQAGQWAVTPSIAASRLLKDDRQVAETSTPVDTLGLVTFQPSFRAHGALGASRSSVSMNLAANYMSGFDNNAFVPGRPIGSWLTFDAFVSAPIRLFKATELSFSVTNILDKDPPFVEAPASTPYRVLYDPSNASPLGRLFSVAFNTRF